MRSRAVLATTISSAARASTHGLLSVSKLSKAKAAKQKRAEKVARAAEAASSEDAALRCKVCGLLCPSKNQLFKHIKQTGHAAFK